MKGVGGGEEEEEEEGVPSQNTKFLNLILVPSPTIETIHFMHKMQTKVNCLSCFPVTYYL